MNKNISLLKNAKYIVIAVFAILAILSAILMGMVGTNYNISDYLDEETDTKISLGIMEEEFGLISNIQVMVDGVDTTEAKAIKDQLKSIKNVVFVNFNEKSADYYKEDSQTALFVILVEGNEYSDTAKGALADVMSLMDEKYGERVNYGGTVMEKKLLSEAIQSEIFLILAISLCLVAILMLITAASWIEPLVLLAASGVAVLLNMGSNIIFGEISYITKAVAAILQLALSIDYSIVLLHSYRAIKEKEEDNDKAMLLAIKEVVRPVSASALTTIAGLLALLFMSFTIGFDIGIVLMKSIVVSAISALTLLPAMLLLFDKLMQKTPKKPLVIKGKMFAEASFKSCKFIIPVALVAIVGCCVLNSMNTYNFVDSCNKNANITDKFGDNGTVIVLFEKSENTEELEKELIGFLENYRTADGKDVLKNAVAYSTTIGQIFDVEKASNDLGISPKDAELLFTIYYFNQNNDAVKMTKREFVDFALWLIDNDEDAQEMVPPGAARYLKLLPELETLLKEDHTADDLIADIETILANAGIEFELPEGMLGEMDLPGDDKHYLIKHLYALYSYDNNTRIDFKDIMNYLMDSGLLPEELSSQLDELKSGMVRLDEIKQEVDYYGFKEYLAKNNINLPNYVLSFIWPGQLTQKYRIIDVLIDTYNDYPQFFPAEIAPLIQNFNTIDNIMSSAHKYNELIPKINSLVNTLGYNVDIEVPNKLVKHLYIMYFIDKGTMPNKNLVINGQTFLEFACATASDLVNDKEICEFLGLELTDDQLENITNACDKLPSDVDKLFTFLNDEGEYTYSQITEEVKKFIKTIETVSLDNIEFSDKAIQGVYVKYAVKNKIYNLDPIGATTLLEFVLESLKDEDSLIAGSIDEEMKKTIEESKENMASAETLLASDNYSRMLLTVKLPPESAESSRFVEAINAKVDEIFKGKKAYVAGEIPTTYDLIKAFDGDNRFISVFTVVSIFLIILIIFKSLSLPVLLVTVIQGAVWIAMSFTLIGGGSMFFMSYIMSMCILMGATIDYGILLSTNYVNYRATMEKREALEAAIDSAMPTIFNSGLILMICGFIVGLVASQTSISSVGFLLFRGTLVSVIMITIVLPSLLYLLDKLVLKLTYRKNLNK